MIYPEFGEVGAKLLLILLISKYLLIFLSRLCFIFIILQTIEQVYACHKPT